MDITNGIDWKKSSYKVFWGEIAPCDHVVQIYENDQVFLDLLEGFVKSGFEEGDCVVVIATTDHLNGLEARLKANGLNMFDLRLKDHYIPINAEEALAEFMVNGWPDEILFRQMVTTLVSRARRNNRQ